MATSSSKPDNVFLFTTCRECIWWRRELNSRDYECTPCVRERVQRIDRRVERRSRARRRKDHALRTTFAALGTFVLIAWVACQILR